MVPTVFSLADVIEPPDDGWLLLMASLAGAGAGVSICSFFSLTGGCTLFGLIFVSGAVATASGAASIGLFFA
jgi:hypothetical protein